MSKYEQKRYSVRYNNNVYFATVKAVEMRVMRALLVVVMTVC